MNRAASVVLALGLAWLSLQGCRDDSKDEPSSTEGGTSTGTSASPGPESGKASGGDAPRTPATAGAGGSEPPSGPNSCGNGERDEGEACDDGNLRRGDGCSNDCTSACESCERDVCPEKTPFTAHAWYSYAYTMEGNAENGAERGTPRAELVQSLLQCVYDSQCVLVYNDADPLISQISLRECFCKNAPDGTEPATYPEVCKSTQTLERGPCLEQMLAAAETDSIETMLTKLTNQNLPIGRVFALLQNCDARVCGGECLPDETGLDPQPAAGAGGAP